MMKAKRFLRTALAAAFAAALLTACDQAALPEVLPEASVPGTETGMGTVTVRATAAGTVRSREAAPGAARTVAPDFGDTTFDTYALTFTSGGTTLPTKTAAATSDGVPVKLPEGDYTLTVTAKKGLDAIATGTASVTVKIDDPKTVEVFLAPTTGGADGEFNYDVTLPTETKGALTLTGPATKKIALSSDGNTDTVNLPPGEYRMAGIIFKGAERVNFTNEAVYLYSGMTSTFTRNFSSVELIEKTAADILESLSDADENDIDHPYPLDLSGLDLEDLTKGDDPLGELFASLSDNIYVDLDLSGCDITEIADITVTIVYSRPNKDKIVSLTLPDSLTSLGDYAFDSCTSLTTVVLPDSLESIGDSAFYGCTSLETIDLSDTDLVSIGYNAFRGCSSLTTIDLSDTDLGIIREYAFESCSSLMSVTLPDSLTSIGDSAFDSCMSLTTIVLPDSLTTIGDYAFYDCTSLETIDLLDTDLGSIGNYAFSGCSSLATIDLPDSLTTIGDYAFSSCSKLASVISHKTTPPALGTSAFYSTPSSLSIKVPSTSSVTAYQGADNWSYYQDKITAL